MIGSPHCIVHGEAVVDHLPIGIGNQALCLAAIVVSKYGGVADSCQIDRQVAVLCAVLQSNGLAVLGRTDQVINAEGVASLLRRVRGD